MSIVRSTVISLALAMLALMPVSARAQCGNTSIVFFSNVTPGGYVLMTGEDFGTVAGPFKIFLVNYQETLVAYDMEIIAWTDKWIEGVIPYWLAEVENQTAEFVAMANCGTAIASAPFTATPAYNVVSSERVKCDTTGPIGNSDYCGWGRFSYPSECFLLYWPSPWWVPTTNGDLSGLPSNFAASFWAYHSSGFGGGSGVQSDVFTVSLKNGWELDEVMPFWVETYSTGDTWAGIWQMSNPGASNLSIQVNWRSDACGQVVYWADIWIEGAVLVPY
jgi:hypothetical protein